MIVSKKTKQLKASRDTAPIFINKIDWSVINPEKNKEKAFILEIFDIAKLYRNYPHIVKLILENKILGRK